MNILTSRSKIARSLRLGALALAVSSLLPAPFAAQALLQPQQTSQFVPAGRIDTSDQALVRRLPEFQIKSTSLSA